MSDLNLNWVKQNFDENNFVFFDVGCMNMDDSIKVRQEIPKAKIYAFECSNELYDNNSKRAFDNGIHYFHAAVCHVDGAVPFNPSLTQTGHHHPDSGSIFTVNPQDNHGKIYGTPYDAKAIRLESFCKRFNVIPDFVHIDVEGAELKVFQNVGECKPKCVWAEVVVFEHYLTGTNRSEFDQLMTDIGYNKIFDGSRDSLYCLADYKVTNY